jgi:ADP-ribose pyrophosphatase YjhB (NUDIX family)
MKPTTPVGKRWARFGPDDPSILCHTPRAGVCISTFIIAKHGSAILLGLPRMHDVWPTKGGFDVGRLAGLLKRGAWLLPATHLTMDEHPDHAAARITREWAGLEGKPKFVMLQSHVRPRRGGNHWDLCFVYELRASRIPKLKPWWSRMEFVSPAKIRRMNLGRAHKDILREGGYL